MSILDGTYSYNSSPYNGAIVSVWDVAAFPSLASYPEFDTPLPNVGYLVASGVTSTEHGGAGSWRLEVSSGGDYFVSIEAHGHITWTYEEAAYDSGALRLGAYYLWVDATGDLRIKSSAPLSDTDGAVAGSQS